VVVVAPTVEVVEVADVVEDVAPDEVVELVELVGAPPPAGFVDVVVA
jgi:hypothetical protein